MNISKRIKTAAALTAAAIMLAASPLAAALTKNDGGAVLAVFGKCGSEGAPIVFSAEDFEKKVVGKDVMLSLRIEVLPREGRLRLAGKNVERGQTVSTDMLSLLTYTPDEDGEIHDSFSVLPTFKKTDRLFPLP